MSLLTESRNFGSDVLNVAKKTHAEKARQSEIWTWVSYGLYTLGWGMSLYGRLRGVDGVAE